MSDVVNHPTHYNSHPSGVECIDIVEHMTFNCGNTVKYLWRAGLKDGNPNIQDLKKARWYLDREIERLSKDEKVVCSNCLQGMHGLCEEANCECRKMRDDVEHPDIPAPKDRRCPKCGFFFTYDANFYNCCSEHNQAVCVQCARQLHPDVVWT